MSNRDGQIEGTNSCAGPNELSWLAGICDPELALSNTDRGTLAAQPYSFTRNGEAWAAATDGKLAVALRQHRLSSRAGRSGAPSLGSRLSLAQGGMRPRLVFNTQGNDPCGIEF